MKRYQIYACMMACLWYSQMCFGMEKEQEGQQGSDTQYYFQEIETEEEELSSAEMKEETNSVATEGEEEVETPKSVEERIKEEEAKRIERDKNRVAETLNFANGRREVAKSFKQTTEEGLSAGVLHPQEIATRQKLAQRVTSASDRASREIEQATKDYENQKITSDQLIDALRGISYRITYTLLYNEYQIAKNKNSEATGTSSQDREHEIWHRYYESMEEINKKYTSLLALSWLDNYYKTPCDNNWEQYLAEETRLSDLYRQSCMKIKQELEEALNDLHNSSIFCVIDKEDSCCTDEQGSPTSCTEEESSELPAIDENREEYCEKMRQIFDDYENGSISIAAYQERELQAATQLLKTEHDTLITEVKQRIENASDDLYNKDTFENAFHGTGPMFPIWTDYLRKIEHLWELFSSGEITLQQYAKEKEYIAEWLAFEIRHVEKMRMDTWSFVQLMAAVNSASNGKNK